MSVNWSRERPPPIADERTQLVGWLDVQRGIVLWKAEGLSETQARRAPLPDSPVMSMAGLLSHLRWTEHCWFEVIFANQNEDQNPQFDEELPEDEDWMPGDRPFEELIAEYRQQCEISNDMVAGASLDDIGVNPVHGGASLRWILHHMLEETARHAGHADVVCELLDGRRGYF